MTNDETIAGNYSLDDCDTAIGRYLETRLEGAGQGCSSVVRTTLNERPDQWYGRLVVHSYKSMPETSTTKTILPAAAAIELLRGYHRCRVELLKRTTADSTRSSGQDLTSSLLAGDYLYTSAYSTLSVMQNAPLDACFRSFTTVSNTIIGAFDDWASRSTWTAPVYCTFVDETAGILGEGAAVVGATLTGADTDDRARIASIGRGLATGRQLQRVLDSDVDTVYTVPSGVAERRLRRYANRCLEDATEAVREISPMMDGEVLEELIERSSIEDVTDG